MKELLTTALILLALTACGTDKASEETISTCIKTERVAQQVGNTVNFTIVRECVEKNGWTMEEWTEARLDGVNLGE